MGNLVAKVDQIRAGRGAESNESTDSRAKARGNVNTPPRKH